MNETILLVDDNAGIRDLFGAVLRHVGFDTAEAGEGLEALTYLRSHAVPALIILDLAMPIMGGPEFRRQQFRDPALSGVPVLLVSGDNDVAAAAAELNIADFLHKPCSSAGLIDAVARGLRRGRPDN